MRCIRVERTNDCTSSHVWKSNGLLRRYVAIDFHFLDSRSEILKRSWRYSGGSRKSINSKLPDQLRSTINLFNGDASHERESYRR